MTMTITTYEIDGNLFEAVSTHALQVGDVVYTQGCLMELRTRDEAADDINKNAYGNVVWLRGYPLTDDLGVIPASWLSRDDDGGRYWVVQGNGRANWMRRI